MNRAEHMQHHMLNVPPDYFVSHSKNIQYMEIAIKVNNYIVCEYNIRRLFVHLKYTTNSTYDVILDFECNSFSGRPSYKACTNKNAKLNTFLKAVTNDECRRKCTDEAKNKGMSGCCESRCRPGYYCSYCKFVGKGQITAGFADAKSVLCVEKGNIKYIFIFLK